MATQDPQTQAPKPIYQSKTAVVNVIIGLSMIIPAVRDWVSQNPALVLTAIGAINIALRVITKGRVTLFGDT